jgi:adenylate cyclase
MAGFFDRMAGRVGLTKPLSIIEDPLVVVRAMTTVLLGGAVQVAVTVAVFFAYGEPAVGWTVIGAGVLFVAAWTWLAVTGDTFGAILISLLAGLVNVFVHVELGGYAYSGGALLFGILLTAAVALLLGTRWAWSVGVFYAALGIVMGVLEPRLRSGRDAPDPDLTTIIFVTVLVTSIAVVPSLIGYLMGKVHEERERAEALLLNMLPADVAAELKREGATAPRRFDSISVLFADIVGFTPMSADMSPEEVVDSLNTVFTHFDGLAERHGVEKLRTIGDSYMAAAGVPLARPDHAGALTAMALDMLDYAATCPFTFRIGINSGPVVAGIIGTHKFQYDVWGDTVNTAARMESHGEPGRIHITDATNDLIRDDFATTPRGPIEVKGKGTLTTWFVEGSLAGGRR